MPKNRRRNRTPKQTADRHRRPHPVDTSLPETLDDGKKQKNFDIAVIALILLVGVYFSVVFYGHQVVPNSDFASFVSTGKSMLSLKLPGSFKRLPVYGMMVAALGHIVGGQHPDLSAGWLLNCVLFSFNGVLLYLLGKKILGPAAAFYVLIVMFNPWTIAHLADPLLETTLIFGVLLTFYLLSVESRWSYLIAAVAAMTRYEGAALILTVFVVDALRQKTWKERLFPPLLYASLASLPLIVWLIIWKTGPAAESRGYLGHFTHKDHIGLGYFNLLWQTAFEPLLQLPSWAAARFTLFPGQAEWQSIQNSAATIGVFSKIVVCIAFIGGAAWAIIKRNRCALTLLFFWFCYVSVHSMRHLSLNRYCLPVTWLTLLIVCRGMQLLWTWLGSPRHVPRALSLIVQATLFIVAVVWLWHLLPHAPHIARASQSFSTLHYGAVVSVCAVCAMMYYVTGIRKILPNLAVAATILLMLISSQFITAITVGDGRRDAEFKQLADWYVVTASPGEKIATTMPQYARLFAPGYASDFYPTTRVEGNSLLEFIEDCRKKNITYIAWDSRLGRAPNDSYYKSYRLERIAPLQSGKDVGPCRFVKRIDEPTTGRYINIYRIESPIR